MSLLVAAALGLASASPAEPEESTSTRLPAPEQAASSTSMEEIYASLRFLLPLSLDPAAFANAENDAAIRQALARLRRSAQPLRDHTAALDAGALYVGNILARDAAIAEQAFRSGEKRRAGYYVQQTLESCLACHARVPAPSANLSRDFLRDPAFEALDADQRGTLLFAVRRFDEAADAFETSFRSDALSPTDLLAPLIDYMTLCVRPLRSAGRPGPILRRVALRRDLWLQYRDDLGYWARTLEAFERDPPTPSVATARRFIDEARSLGLYPSDRRAFAHYLLASRVLHDLLATEPSPTAEHYFLLGIAELRIGRNHWITQAKFYLELAIRLDPTTDVAYRALALLEEEILADYAELGLEAVPDPLRDHLQELRELVMRSRTPREPPSLGG